MARSGSLSGEEWELLSDHNLGILSCSDAETSEGGEAGAVIEALEETPRANLQGVTLGSLPQFLGGWYGSSPPAAGQTFSVDLGAGHISSPPGSCHARSQPPSPVAAAVPEAAFASDDFEDPIDDLPTAPAQPAVADPTAGQQQGAAPAATMPCDSTSSDSSDGSDRTTEQEHPAAASSADSAYIREVCRRSAISLAGLLLLIIIMFSTAGSPSPASGPSLEVLAAPAQRITSSDSFRPYGSSSNRRASPECALHPLGLLGAVLLGVVPTAPCMAAAAAPSNVAAAAERARPELPWWLRDEARPASRRGGAPGAPVKLPPLPPSLQLVAEGSMRANMSASQRLRLHLWLLHCAARNTSAGATARRGQAVMSPLPSTLYAPLLLFAAPAHVHPLHAAAPTQRPHQCPNTGTAAHWLAPVNPAGHAGPLCAAAPAAPLHGNYTPAAAAGSAQQDHAAHAVDAASFSFLHPFQRPRCRRTPASSASTARTACNAALCFAFRCRAGTAASNVTCPAAAAAAAAAAQPFAPPPAPTPLGKVPVAPWAYYLAPAAPRVAQPPPATAAPASTAPTAAAGRSQLILVQPTQPVPPLYRPPLPCLMLGSSRPNGTAAAGGPRQASAQQHSPQHTSAAPAARTKAWPNTTAAHQQHGFAASRPRPRVFRFRCCRRCYRRCGRVLAMGTVRWGWHQHARPASVCGSPSGWAMQPLASQKAATGTTASAKRASSSASTGSRSNSSWAGPFLPMLLPAQACAAAERQQAPPQQQQPGLLSLPVLPPVVPGGLTVPMLPPVSEDTCREQRGQAISLGAAARSPFTARSTRSMQSAVTTTSSRSAAPAAEAAGAWQQLLNSIQHPSRSPSTCSAGAMPGLLLVPEVQAPSMAPWAAAGAAQFAQQQHSAEGRCLQAASGRQAPQHAAASGPGCTMQCGRACLGACGSVCVERCAGMPPLYVAIPASVRASPQATRCQVPPGLLTAVAPAEARAHASPVGSGLGRPRAPFTLPVAAAGAIPLPPAQEATGSPVTATSAAVSRPWPAVLGAAALMPRVPAWALLPPGMRLCGNNATTLASALAAAAKLAAAAADLASAAASLADAAARLQGAAPSGCLAPALCPTGFLFGHVGAVRLALPSTNESAASGAQGGQEAEAGETKWVASLVTLPMLPPAREDRAAGGVRGRGADSGRARADKVNDCSSAMTPFGPYISCNVSADETRAASQQKPGQPMWLAPVM